jgi:hypothetical protein
VLSDKYVLCLLVIDRVSFFLRAHVNYHIVRYTSGTLVPLHELAGQPVYLWRSVERDRGLDQFGIVGIRAVGYRISLDTMKQDDPFAYRGLARGEHFDFDQDREVHLSVHCVPYVLAPKMVCWLGFTSLSSRSEKGILQKMETLERGVPSWLGESWKASENSAAKRIALQFLLADVCTLEDEKAQCEMASRLRGEKVFPGPASVYLPENTPSRGVMPHTYSQRAASMKKLTKTCGFREKTIPPGVFAEIKELVLMHPMINGDRSLVTPDRVKAVLKSSRCPKRLRDWSNSRYQICCRLVGAYQFNPSKKELETISKDLEWVLSEWSSPNNTWFAGLPRGKKIPKKIAGNPVVSQMILYGNGYPPEVVRIFAKKTPEPMYDPMISAYCKMKRIVPAFTVKDLVSCRFHGMKRLS